jgi:branched-chain amino acid transport system permease protein
LVVLLAAAAVGVGGQLSRYELDLTVTLLSYVVLAHAWNALAGFGGQVSLGVGAFVGTGAYSAGLLMVHAAAPFAVALLAAGAAAGLLALVLSVPLLRLHGDYFAVGTLAVTLALEAWALNWPFVGRSEGLQLPVGSLPDGQTLYELAVAVTAVAFLVTIWIQRSRFGLRLMAVRDDEAAATGLGVSAFRHRLLVFVVSSVLTGLVGGLVALQQISFEPTGILSLNWTVDALLMTIVGGMGTFFGPILGAVLVYYGLTTVLAALQAFGLVVEGALLVAVVRFAPQGLWPLGRQLVRQMALRARMT